MMVSGRVPDGVAWGSYPSIGSASSNSTASQCYNVMVHSFTPAAFKGIIFLCSEKMVEKEQGAYYGSELSALANCWKAKFGGEDPHFFYTIPGKSLAPKISRPEKIKGKSTGIEFSKWSDGGQIQELIDRVVSEVKK